MFFKQFHHEGLGHASYLVGSEETGEALVFDPRRDVDSYLTEARELGLRIQYALDSHGHNDYLSGLTEIVARTGSQVLGSAEASSTTTDRSTTASSSSLATWALRCCTPGPYTGTHQPAGL